jgi:hypothetical protein
MTRDHLTNLLLAPSIKGAPAALCVLLSAGVPSLIRTAVDGFVSGCELTIYLPFVLLAVIFMGWKHAVATVMLSALLAETVVLGSHHSVLSACSIYSLSVFLSASAVMIALVHGLRRLIDWRLSRIGSSEGDIVFSLENGQAWASWYGQTSAVQLGPQHAVAEMMQDFIAQLELGKRLAQAGNARP